jgi:hypothetical protein
MVIFTAPKEVPTMIRLTCLPKQVANWLQVLRPMFRHRHYLNRST